MPQYRAPVVTASGSEVLPTAAATLYTNLFPASFDSSNCQVYAEFYSDAAGSVAVTPTAGTITVYGSPMGNNFLPPASNPVITATACATPLSTYLPPQFTGKLVQGQVVLAGITGAAYCRIWFWKY